MKQRKRNRFARPWGIGLAIGAPFPLVLPTIPPSVLSVLLCAFLGGLVAVMGTYVVLFASERAKK